MYLRFIKKYPRMYRNLCQLKHTKLKENYKGTNKALNGYFKR